MKEHNRQLLIKKSYHDIDMNNKSIQNYDFEILKDKYHPVLITSHGETFQTYANKVYKNKTKYKFWVSRNKLTWRDANIYSKGTLYFIETTYGTVCTEDIEKDCYFHKACVFNLVCNYINIFNRPCSVDRHNAFRMYCFKLVISENKCKFEIIENKYAEFTTNIKLCFPDKETGERLLELIDNDSLTSLFY